MSRLLIVEDDEALGRALAINLKVRGHQVVVATNAATALRIAAASPLEAVVLDLGLPDMSGVAVITGLRGWSSIPIIVLSARDGQRDKVAALDAGADDYVTKPFGMDELLARIRAAVRRAEPAALAEPVLNMGDLTIDLAAKRVRRSGSDVRLTPTEWHLLEALVRRPGRLVSHRQLLEEVWGPSYWSQTNYLRVYMAQLRRKLEADPAKPQLLITEPGLGYRFEPKDAERNGAPTGAASSD